MKSIGEVFKELRKNSPYTVRDLASKMKKSTSAYAKMESGKVMIRINDIEDFAKIFEMSIIDIFTYPEKYVLEGLKEGNKTDLAGNNQSCKWCEEKERVIKSMEITIETLQKQNRLLETFQASHRKTGSG